MKGYKMKLLFLIVLSLCVYFASVASAIDQECVDFIEWNPTAPYPSPDGNIDVCTPVNDSDGKPIPETQPLSCLLEVNVKIPTDGGAPLDTWKSYAIANTLPGSHIVFAASDQSWERGARVSCKAGATPGEVLAFVATFPAGVVAKPALLSIQ